MASSSSFTKIIPPLKYDVFVSFRGKDTRDNFTSHLYAALCQKKIETFIDNQLIRGDDISPSLLDAIEGSKISVIIFSKRYASSKWCLKELVKILECRNKYGQMVIPVFYHVDPSDVRNLTGKFGKAFSKLEKKIKRRLDKLQRWRVALRETANLSGFSSHAIRPESVLVEEIVKDILKRLNGMFPNDNKDKLVGVEPIIKELESLLSTSFKDVYTLGIWGIGGIGKTTIAGGIFNKISSHFEASYFIQNVREESEKSGGLAQLRRELLSTLLEEVNMKTGIPSISFNFEWKRLSRRKVLVIFDDVTHFEQIKFLIGSLDWLMQGSRIIITTRDKQVLKNCRVDEIYEVKKLIHVDALKLFSQYAFGQSHPDASYLKLSNKAVAYAQGVPLALKVLGGFLFDRGIEEWKSAINQLEKSPHMDIQKVLKVSYDGLNDEQRNIFLDIACFFKGEDRDLIIKFLNSCGFSAEIGISVLIDKSLIIISHNKVGMHDLLQEMGREIVRQESVKHPGQRSRLWHHEDVFQVLSNNTGTEEIEGISLDMSKIRDIYLSPPTFKKMHKLRFIKFYNSLYREDKNKVHHFQYLESTFTELRYLHWQGYPMKSLPSNIHAENLISLKMPYSNITQLWNDVQHLVNLKYIDLSYSKQLSKVPDLSLAPNLESMNLEGCTSLIETDLSIQYLNKLVILNLRYCESLKSLPTGINLKSLKKLLLPGCSNLNGFPEISCNIEELILDGTAVEELPSSVGRLSRLLILSLKNCCRLESLPSSLCKLKSLQNLDVSGCLKLDRLPHEFGNLEALKELKAEGTAITEVPSSIACLHNLDMLSFKGLKGHKPLRWLLPISLNLHGLTYLQLSDCAISELPESLGQLSSLSMLFLDKNNFERIPESIVHLSKLFWLHLSYCDRLQSLPQLPCDLNEVRANGCKSLEKISSLPIRFTPASHNSQEFNFINCLKLDQNALAEIVADALLEIQLMATAWWEEPNKEDDDNVPEGFICFPGNKIPECFHLRSMGSSITLELPPGWFNDNFVGLALCAIVAFQDHYDDDRGFELCCECELKTEDGVWHVASSQLFLCHGIDIGSNDHLFLGYDFRMFSAELSECHFSNEAFIQFFVEDFYEGHIEFCEVIKCGIHLLYADDFGGSMEDYSVSFSSDEDDDQEPLPKRLKYSESP